MDDFYIALITTVTLLIPQVLVMVIAFYLTSLPGRMWLITSMLLVVLGQMFIIVIPQLSDSFDTNISLIGALILVYSSVCFSCFIFNFWAVHRYNQSVEMILFSFTGRVPRAVFWISLCLLVPFGAPIIFYSLRIIFNSTGLINILSWLILVASSILMIWVSFAIYAKRWHDLNKTGLFSFVLIAPLPGALYLIAMQGFVRGSQESNQYGDNTMQVQQS